MKTLICYYSNTGNTLLVSKYFAKHLKNSSTDFFNIISDNVPNVLNYDLIIFSTWTDYMNIPKKMIDFIKNIKGQNKFSIALSTYGGVSGQTISNLKKLIKKQNFSFVGGFALHTPENTPILITKGHANENAPNENELNKYLSHNNLSLTSIRISIEYLYQLNNTALDLTIEKANIYPKITLKEINYLFPNLIPESLINIENRNESIYLHTSNKINEEDEIDDVNNTINDYIIKDFSKFDELKKIIKVPKEIKNIDTYFNKCYKFLENGFNDDNELLNMFSRYMIFMLKKADKRDSSHNIKLSTITDYFSITIKYAFNFIIAEGELTDRTIAYIYENIQNNDNLTVKTKKKYRRVVNFFLRNFTTYSSIAKINMALDVRRSIIFKEELDILIERLISNDKFKYQNEKDIKIKSIYRSVFTLLLFYTGLRKTELRTRLSKDIYFLDEETLVIDVNSQGFRETMKSTNEKELKLKSNNAKRRVKVIIEDKNHLRIIRQYINFIESKKYKFLFPLINENCTFMKKHVITENLIIDISKELQSITKRYTPLHSLRHSFATNYFVRNKAKNNPKMVYELSNILGHSEPNITIENYLHLDFLKILTI